MTKIFSSEQIENILERIKRYSDDRTITTLSHQKIGTVHQLTGLNGMEGLVPATFVATDDFVMGDTFSVDGIPYSIQMSDDEPVPNNVFTAVSAMVVVLDTNTKKMTFKSSDTEDGGVNLPAGTWVIVDCFMANGTFMVPITGRYRVTVVGHGGKGGTARYDVSSSTYYGGGGGGAGGACEQILDLVKGKSYPITVTASTSSFGSLLSAKVGKNASNEIGGAPGTSSGGTELSVSAGKNGSFGDDFYNGHSGGNGGYVSGGHLFSGKENANGADGDYSTRPGGFTVDTSTGNSAGAFLLYPFGIGGGGGAHVRWDEGSYYVNIYADGGHGGFGAVIIELLLEGVNDT